jgi:tetratricopeptide (TPR) repeat protein
MWSNCVAEHSFGPFQAPLRLAGPLAAAWLLAACATPGPGPHAGASLDDRRFDRAAAAVAAGVESESLPLLRDLAADYPTLAGPEINLGIVHAAAGRDTEAEAHFRRALGVAPGHAAAWSELGIVLRRQGRLAEADEAYLRALAADPDYPLAWRNRGVLLDLYLGRPDDALECYQRYLELAGGRDADPLVARWVAELELRSGSRVAGR